MNGRPVFVATITSLERLRLSVNGNPRFRVTFDNGTVAQTQSDANVAYGIENREYREGPVEVYLTKTGRIWDLRPVPRATDHP